MKKIMTMSHSFLDLSKIENYNLNKLYNISPNKHIKEFKISDITLKDYIICFKNFLTFIYNLIFINSKKKIFTCTLTSLNLIY